MKRILIICNTPFQFVVMTHILTLYYSKYEVDIVISDQFRGSAHVVENAKKCGFFRKVYYIKNAANRRGNKISRIANWFKRIVVGISGALKISSSHYDDILFSNIQIFTKILISILKIKNKTCKIHIAEEGLGTYSKLYKDSDAPNSLYRKYIDRKGIMERLSTLFLFNPQFLTWDFPLSKITKLPPLDAKNKRFMEILNGLFDYDQCKDIYDKKLIFFEESYYVEGDVVPDIEIVEQIANKIGKDNIMVKIHPRNPINRFKELGYKTNQDSFIPWELIVLNQDMRDKVFVTIASGAAINPYLYMGMKITNYSLLNCLEHRPGIMNTSVGDVMNMIYNTYPDVLCAPKSIQEFLDNLSC